VLVVLAAPGGVLVAYWHARSPAQRFQKRPALADQTIDSAVRTPQGWTVHFISAATETPDLDLPALELSLANSANPLIVERIPFSESISLTQDRQSIVEFDMRSHHPKSTLRIASKQTIGKPDDRQVGENLT
jgi:hypothetical protein